MDSDLRHRLAAVDLWASRLDVDEKVARMAALPAYEQIDNDGEPILDLHADYVEGVIDLPFEADMDGDSIEENLECFPDLYPDGLYGVGPPGGHTLIVIDEADHVDERLLGLMLEMLDADPPEYQRRMIRAIYTPSVSTGQVIRAAEAAEHEAVRERRYAPHFVVGRDGRVSGRVSQIAPIERLCITDNDETLGT